MSDANEIDYDRRTHLAMDKAFRARMHAAIEAGLESAPIGVVTSLERKPLNTFQQSLGCPPPPWATFN